MERAVLDEASAFTIRPPRLGLRLDYSIRATNIA